MKQINWTTYFDQKASLLQRVVHSSELWALHTESAELSSSFNNSWKTQIFALCRKCRSTVHLWICVDIYFRYTLISTPGKVHLCSIFYLWILMKTEMENGRAKQQANRLRKVEGNKAETRENVKWKEKTKTTKNNKQKETWI